MSTVNFIRRLTSSHRFDMALGLLLVLISGDEVFEALSNGLQAEDIDSHLGVTLFGLASIIKALPDFFEGLGYLSRARE